MLNLEENFMSIKYLSNKDSKISLDDIPFSPSLADKIFVFLMKIFLFTLRKK